jgi:hypothetical protein
MDETSLRMRLKHSTFFAHEKLDNAILGAKLFDSPAGCWIPSLPF